MIPLEPATRLLIRCPLCGGFNHAPLYEHFLRCKLCSLAFPKIGVVLPPLTDFQIAGSKFRFKSWNNWLSRSIGYLPLASRDDAYFAPTAVRMFAARENGYASAVRSSVPLLPIFVPWRFGQTIQCNINLRSRRDASAPDPRLTLGVIAAPTARRDVIDLCADLAKLAGRVVVVLDTVDAAAAATLEEELRASLREAGDGLVLVVGRQLDGDFATQRNQIQERAVTDWVLQLDCDERLTDGTKRRLAAMIDDAEREGWSAVGLTRRNVVDGMVSALYPDVQYRLLRRSVRYTRAVHEYPLLRHDQKSFVHLGAEIIHRLDGERLLRREAFYEAIQDGAGRTDDTALLRMPLESDVRLPA